MKIEKLILDDHQAKLIVEIEAEKMGDMKKRAAKKIARSIKIPGFRPGKAPYPVVMRQVGEAAIIEDALDLLVADIYPKIIKEAEIQTYGPGKLENVQSMDPPILEFIIPLDAEVTLGDYHSIRSPYEPQATTEEDIDKVIDDVKEQQAIIEPVDRPAEEGDLVTIRISADRSEAEEDENSKKQIIEERTIQIPVKTLSDEEKENLDSSQMEWPFPGFSEKLIGSSAENEMEFEYEYPEAEIFEELSGQCAKFHIVVENIKEKILPELDDELISSLGDFEDIDSFREHIGEILEKQSQFSYDENYDQQIMEQAIEQTDFKYPPQMLEDEIDSFISDIEKQLSPRNLDMDLYLKTRNLDKDGLREEVTPNAEFRLKKALFLFELAQVENIQVNDEALQAKTAQTVSYLAQSLSKTEARKLNDIQIVSNIAHNIMIDMLADDSMEYYRDIAKGLQPDSLEEPSNLEEETQSKEETSQNQVEPGEKEEDDTLIKDDSSEHDLTDQSNDVVESITKIDDNNSEEEE